MKEEEETIALKLGLSHLVRLLLHAKESVFTFSGTASFEN